MAMSLSITPSLLVGIAFCRDGRDFSERERLTLDTLRPHLIQAYRNAVAVERNRLELQSLHRALEEMDKGVVSLSREGRLEMATERARRLLAEYFRPPARPEELPEDLRRWVQGQLSLLCRGDDAPPPRKPLVLERGCERITIRFVDDGAQEGGGYMLLLEEQLPPLSPQDLASSLGLTRREGEVLHLVARGETDQQVASSLHLSTRTVNKHLQNIYRKFGVSRRAEAIARTLEVSDTHRS